MTSLPFTLTPEYREYVWGGAKLRPQVVPTAEAWVVYEGNRVSSGEYKGMTLAELSQTLGADLLGARAIETTGRRFPVLIKILDCAQWLSLQVHPNDEQAKRLEGESFFGKTEAWVVLENEPEAKLIAGMKKNISAQMLADAIKAGNILDYVEEVKVKTGDVLFMNPGTIHALGPGLLIYEIQQTSDITYRVYDWGRPQTETRKLHIEKALAVANPNAISKPVSAPLVQDGEVKTLAQCQYFQLEQIEVEKKNAALNTRGESFHALTVVEGQSQVRTGESAHILNKFETLLIPASCGAYEIIPLKKSRLLKASA